MQISIIGNGKTGSQIVKILGQENVNVFDSKRKPSVDELNKSDAIIIFIPGRALEELLPVLLKVDTPIICGTTGYKYSQSMIDEINDNAKTWVVANNFSLAMVFVQECLNSLGKINKFIGNANYHIEEIHHTKKLDAPSGTAVSWREWLGNDCEISSIREADVNGIHTLSLETDLESIEFSHTSKSRELFAQGAIWTAKYVYEKKITGFNQFEKLVKGAL